MADISVIIHTRNAGQYLQEVIDHLKGFQEILVCDMESTDSTLEIARRNGCEIMTFPNCGYAEAARDQAMRRARHDWVLYVDADEIIPDPLCDYLKNIAENPGDVRAVRIPRKNLLLDGWSAATYPDYQLRFMNRRYAEWPAHIHSFPRIDGKVHSIPKGRKDLAMVHISPSMGAVMERMNRYTTLELERRRNKRPGLLRLWFDPKVKFLKSYILKGGFLHGVTGYVAARNDANYRFYLLTKLYEEQHPPKSGS